MGWPMAPRLAARCARQRRFCLTTSSHLPERHVRLLRPAIPRDAGLAYFGAKDADLGAATPGHAGEHYQRTLPPQQAPFASQQGRRLFKEALEAGTMESYFFLAEQFRTQDEPTSCGLTTLAMVLNSLRIDPMRTWKGVWRWFNEQNLACCTGPDRVRAEGLSFDMFRALAGCNGAEVLAHRAPDCEVSEGAGFVAAFRAAVKAASSTDERQCLVVCYSRAVLGQSGAGHFSPIGGYHEASDRVLILDVARFKYPSHWVPLEDLAQAMLKVDPATGKPRGYLQLRLQRPTAQRGAPLRVPFVPPAAGRRLAEAFAAKLRELEAEVTCPLPEGSRPYLVPMRRWLAAVASVEPQVFGQLLQVGDLEAVQEVLSRLAAHGPFVDLCEAYEQATGTCELGARFPPLRFQVGQPAEDLTLWSCGELWVLLLLLLPEHMQVLVAPEIVQADLAKGITRAIRGPWALPLEAQRETLSHILPEPRRRCELPKPALR